MTFKVRLLAYLMLYSTLDTAKPDDTTTRPGLQDEGMHTLRTSGKVSNDMTKGTTIENIAEGSGFIVHDLSISNTGINRVSLVNQTTTSYKKSTDAPGLVDKDVTGSIDREGYILARKVIMWGFTPIFVLVGFTCNCITAHALRAMTSSGSSTSYLRALAVSDAAYNLLGVYLTIGVVLEDLGYESVRDFNVYAYSYQMLFLHSALNRLSSGFTILLSAERFLAVFFPFYVKQAFLTRRPVIVITVSAIIISAFNVVLSFRYEARESVDPLTGRSRVMRMETKFGRDQRAFFIGYIKFGMITFYVIPICLVFVLNAGIIIKLILMQRKRAKMTSAARGRDHQITRSLLLISLMFLVTNIPGLVSMFTGKLQQGLSEQFNGRFLHLLMVDLAFALGNLNSATNFFILTMSSSAFRNSLSAVFRRSG